MIMRADVAATMAQAIVDTLNASCGTNAVLQVWDGTVPTTTESADSGTMIGELTIAGNVFGSVVSFISTANGFTDDTNATAGNATYWRLKTSTTGDTILQWTEATDMVTDDPVFSNGDTVHLVSLTLSITITPPDA